MTPFAPNFDRGNFYKPRKCSWLDLIVLDWAVLQWKLSFQTKLDFLISSFSFINFQFLLNCFFPRVISNLKLPAWIYFLILIKLFFGGGRGRVFQITNLKIRTPSLEIWSHGSFQWVWFLRFLVCNIDLYFLSWIIITVLIWLALINNVLGAPKHSSYHMLE